MAVASIGLAGRTLSQGKIAYTYRHAVAFSQCMGARTIWSIQETLHAGLQDLELLAHGSEVLDSRAQVRGHADLSMSRRPHWIAVQAEELVEAAEEEPEALLHVLVPAEATDACTSAPLGASVAAGR
eukprot:scaffold1853_cov367-Prasinococcus_capsulatus_cf.AAC.8